MRSAYSRASSVSAAAASVLLLAAAAVVHGQQQQLASSSSSPLSVAATFPCGQANSFFDISSLECTACSQAAGYVVSADKLRCVLCDPSAGNDTSFSNGFSGASTWVPAQVAAAGGTCQCAAPAAGTVISSVTGDVGRPLQRCLSCPAGSSADAASGSCLPPSGPLQSASSDLAYVLSTLNARGAGISTTTATQAVVQAVLEPSGQQRAYTIPQSAPLAAWLGPSARTCMDGGSREGCNALANLCALQMYSPEAAACQIYDELLAAAAAGANSSSGRGGASGSGGSFASPRPAATGPLPWLYYLPGSPYLTADDVDVEVSLASSAPPLRFVLSTYDLNGTWLGLANWTLQLQLCGGGAQEAGLWTRFGVTYSSACTLDLSSLLAQLDYSSNGPRFYDPYLATAAGRLYPLPVQLVNRPEQQYSSDASLPSGHVRRFFFVDTLLGTSAATAGGSGSGSSSTGTAGGGTGSSGTSSSSTGSGTSSLAVVYPAQLALTVQIQPDARSRIRPPLLTIRYAALSTSQPAPQVPASFSAAYTNPPELAAAFWHAWQALLIVLLLLLGGPIWLWRMVQYVRRRAPAAAAAAAAAAPVFGGGGGGWGPFGAAGGGRALAAAADGSFGGGGGGGLPNGGSMRGNSSNANALGAGGGTNSSLGQSNAGMMMPGSSGGFAPTAAVPLDLELLLFGALAAVDVLSGTLALVLFVVSLYWLVLTKLQDGVLLLLLPDDQLYNFWVVLVLALVGQSVGLLQVVYRQISVDIFFIDWEKPRRLLAKGGGREEPGPVAAWRSLLVANEWNELQGARYTSPAFTLLTVVFILQGANMQAAAHMHPNQDDLTSYANVPQSMLLRFAIAAVWFAILGIAQVLWRVCVVHRFAGPPLHGFIDLLFLANTSAVILDEQYSGYYLHGRNQMRHADTTLAELNASLVAEEEGLVGGRGLVNSYAGAVAAPGGGALLASGPTAAALNDNQTFTLHVSPMLRRQYEAMLLSQVEQAAAQQRASKGVVTTAVRGPSRPRSAAISSAAAFGQLFKGVIDEVERNHATQVLIPTYWQRLLRLPPAAACTATLLAHDWHNAFASVLFLGQEGRLYAYEALVFAGLHCSLGSAAAAGFITLLVQRVVAGARRHWGTNNLARKTLVDQHFLI